MEEKEDFEEDVSIDLGKIKGLFKRKKEEAREESKQLEDLPSEKGIKIRENEKIETVEKDSRKIRIQSEKKELGVIEKEEEVSVDFSKIKGFFKRRRVVEKEESSEEELSFDAKKIVGYYNRSKKNLIPAVLILIAVFLSIYVRVQPAYLPVTDGWAKSSVYDYFKSQIRAEIDKQYPNLPSQNKEILVDNEFQRFLEQNKELVEEQIKGTSDYFKSQLQDENGLTYLTAIDPYFWLRHAENVLENGHPGDILKDGRPYDTYMFAPNGRFVPHDMLHAYFEAYLFKFLHIFNGDLELIKVAFFTPVILSALAVIPAFFIARRIAGNIGGFVAAVLVAVHPAILVRTPAGFADTDAYTILLPLLITWFFLIAFDTENVKKRIIFSGLSGFFVGIFAFSWGGWWYIFDFILATVIIYLIYYTTMHRRELKKGIGFVRQPAVKNTLIILSIFIISAGVFTTMFDDFNGFKSAPLYPFKFMRLKLVAITKVWPNVYTTVAEQNPASLESVISQIGYGGRSKGKFLLFIAAIGVLLTLFKKDIHGKRDVKYAILLGLWIVATLYASTKGIRYAQLVVPAFSISLGVALGLAHKFIVEWSSKELNINKVLISSVLIALIVFIFLAGPVRAGKRIGDNEITDMNDAWYSALDKINREAEPDAIITSWWDFGHWFKSIGNRPVTFDGTSQNSPQAHWVGKALLTSEEDVAVGILRMLDCGANNAFDELDKIIKDPVKTIDIINEIIVLDKDKAIRKLQDYGLSEEETEPVIRYTHCDAPESYFITSDDMVEKSGVWAHFGIWDFERSMIYNTLQKEEYINNMQKSLEFMEERFNYTEERAKDTYFKIQSFERGGKEVNDWIAPWPGYASGLSGCGRDGEMVICSVPQGGQVLVNLTTMNADIPTSEGIMHPNSLVYVTEEGIVEKEFNKTIGLSMVLIPSGNGFRSILTSPQLAASMFTRLFFLKGHGLQHFKLFTHEISPVGGAEIYIWKVDWAGGEENYVGEFFPVEETVEINETKKNLNNNS